jgi:hypothetical protein
VPPFAPPLMIPPGAKRDYGGGYGGFGCLTAHLRGGAVPTDAEGAE